MPYRTRFQHLYDQASAIAQATACSIAIGRLPSLFFVTDPQRTPRPEDIAADLPAGCGIIYRHFGEADARERARRLREIADERSLVFMIGDDDALAMAVGADGVHLSQKRLPSMHALHKACPDLLLSVACHDLAALMALGDDAPLSAVFVSPVFASRSASAQGVVPLGVDGVRAMTAATRLPVYGLGGITADTVAELQGCGLSGFGAVEAFVEG